jgi:FkbM family methyltransferase
MEMMRRLGINLVLDVGANDGSYAAEVRADGYEGRIWSFEPMREPFSRLDKLTTRDPLWKAINTGCGAVAGSATIHVAGNSYSSSLLPMVETHVLREPTSAYVAEETVSICSLDESVMPQLSPDDKLWLKIDTQGYEAEVLKGAQKLAANILALECELSLIPLYEGQMLIDQMLALIYAMGFRMVGVAPVFLEPETSYMLQVDGIFLKGTSGRD